jgi:hypothetical protein
LPAEGAATVLAAVQAKAEKIKMAEDLRTKAQRRADGLVQLCADYLTGDTNDVKINMDGSTVPARSGRQAPRYHGLKPQIHVSVALSTLLGFDEQPGELDGHGPIPADLVRRLAADPSGTWRRLVTDELGQLVDYGRTTYKPPADLARYVIARDRTCRAPGCERPAAKSDLHHVTPWSEGGRTNADNLVPACERHHYAVHDNGGLPANENGGTPSNEGVAAGGVAGGGSWRVTRADDGAAEWISPTGHTYRVPPATYPIDVTAGKIKNDMSARAGPGDGGTPPDAVMRAGAPSC